MNVILNPTSYTPGPGISITEMETLRQYRPNWPMDTPSNTIENYMFDERYPEVCHVYPPAGDAAYVELAYVVRPDDCVLASNLISVPDQFANALEYFVLARAYEKAAEDQETPNAGERAKHYYELFYQSLGVKTASDAKMSPNQARQDGTPPRTPR